jgi:hypothetical protein
VDGANGGRALAEHITAAPAVVPAA